MARVLILGVPRAGKSTYARTLGGRVQCTDTLKGTPGEVQAASRWLDAPGPWIVEGWLAMRALSAWLAAHPTGLPCDRLVVMPDTRDTSLTSGQRGACELVRTIWRRIRPQLERRGLKAEERTHR